MTAWFRNVGAKEGDVFEIARHAGSSTYTVLVVKTGDAIVTDTDLPTSIQLRGWRRVH
jgi:hypothetical protein